MGWITNDPQPTASTDVRWHSRVARDRELDSSLGSRVDLRFSQAFRKLSGKAPAWSRNGGLSRVVSLIGPVALMLPEPPPRDVTERATDENVGWEVLVRRETQ